jgi:hypothetical protein
MPAFYDYFRENMAALGQPAPENLFGNLPLALGSAQTLMSYVDKFGTRATVKDMIVAGTRLEQLNTIGAMYASFYVGAVIGSLAVATGRTLSGGTSLADVLALASQQGLNRPWLPTALATHPQFYNSARARMHPAAIR